MKLIIDSGNTSITFGLFENKKLQVHSKPLAHYRLRNELNRMPEEYLFWLKSLMEIDKLSLFSIEEVSIACVVPEILENLCVFSEKHLGCDPTVVHYDSKGITFDISDRIEAPWTIGADRLANAEACVNFHEGLRIVIDFGTATTFDVISVDNIYLGGIVCPGLELSRKILATNTSKLPWIELSNPPDKAVGTSTIEAMSSGLIYGSLSMVEGLLSRIEDELSQAADSVIATGGMGKMMADLSQMISSYDAHFTLKGIGLIAEEKKSNTL